MLKRTEKLIKKKYSEFFVPTLLTAMANSIAMLVDSTIINLTLGQNAFAAVNLMSPIVQLYSAVSILFGLSCATLIAKIKGEDGTDTEKSSASFTTAILMLIGVSIAFIIAGVAMSENIASLLTKDPELFPLVKNYLIPYAAGSPITLLMTSGVYILRTEGRPKFSSAIIIVSNIVNLIGDIILISLFGLGVAGAAIATVAGNAVGLVMFLSHFRRKDNTLHFSIKLLQRAKSFGENLKGLISYGISGAAGAVLITVRMFFLNSQVQRYGGAISLVAFSVVSLCQILDSAFVAGACQTFVHIISMLYGEKDFTGIRTALKKTLRILLISSISVMLFMIIFAGTIVGIYGMKDPESAAVGINAVRICAGMLPGDALTFIGLYYFIAIGRNRQSTIISVVNGVVFIIPLGLILPLTFGINGVWTALVLSQYLTLLLTAIIAVRIRREEKVKIINSGELFAFSLNGTAWNEALESELFNEPNICTAKDPESLRSKISEALRCLTILDGASLEKHRHSKDTDVRICNDEIIIKNSGAAVIETEFENAVMSKVLGFNRIEIK